MQEAAGKNQEFQNTSKSLNFFLKNLPDNKISPSDDLSQVNSKQTSQKVSLFVSRSSEIVGDILTIIF